MKKRDGKSKLTLHITIELLDPDLHGVEGQVAARAELLRGLDAARASIAGQPLQPNDCGLLLPTVPGVAVRWRVDQR